MKPIELINAYHKVAAQARHVAAAHRRMAMQLSAALADADKLQRALDEAQRLEQEFGLEELHRDTILSGG